MLGVALIAALAAMHALAHDVLINRRSVGGVRDQRCAIALVAATTAAVWAVSGRRSFLTFRDAIGARLLGVGR